MKQVAAIGTGGIIGTGLGIFLSPAQDRTSGKLYVSTLEQQLGKPAAAALFLASATTIHPLKAFLFSGIAACLFTRRLLMQTPPKQNYERGLEFRASVTVNLPVEKVFDFWADPTNFPYFMSHLQNVKDLGDGRSRWIVAGPNGTSIRWDSRITCMEPMRFLGWESSREAQVPHTVLVSFLQNGLTTEVTVKTSYRRRSLSDNTAAYLFGFDPKSLLEKDLHRMRLILERTNLEVRRNLTQNSDGHDFH